MQLNTDYNIQGYKPELINRFDGVVLFHTLNDEHLGNIAQIMLGRLKERIHSQGYELIINDVLVKALVEGGFNPQFGARPMRRVIQEKIKRPLAEQLLFGDLVDGGHVIIVVNDAGELELIATPDTRQLEHIAEDNDGLEKPSPTHS